jgi:hypothetical protein
MKASVNPILKHHQEYREEKGNADRWWRKLNFKNLEEEVKEHPIKIRKFNHSVDMETTNFGYQEAMMSISDDGK